MLARSTLLLTAEGFGSRRPAKSRAYNGIDSSSVGYHLAPADLGRQRRDRGLQQAAKSADLRRSSFTGESDSASVSARNRGDDMVSTTPVGSYINGVLGGRLHPGLVDVDADEEAEAVGDAQPQAVGLPADAVDSLEASASEQVVRLRAENAELRERLLEAEQRLSESEAARAALEERLAAASEELEEANDLLEEERRRATAAARSRGTFGLDGSAAALHSSMEDAADPSVPQANVADSTPALPPAASPSTLEGGGSLEADLEVTNRRMQSLESSVQQLQRQLTAEHAPKREKPAETREDAKEEEEDFEEPDYVTQLTNQALSTMTKEIAELRAGAETLRARMRQLDDRRRQQLREARDRQQVDERVNDEALLSVSVGLEATRRQNQQLHRQLALTERERLEQSRRLKRLQAEAKATQQAWGEWSAKADSGREGLHQLSNANVQLRDRLRLLDAAMAAQREELDAARADATSKAERCKQLANDGLRLQRQLREAHEEAKRLRQASAKLGETNDGLARLLAAAEAENRDAQRRLLRLSDAAFTKSAADTAGQIREAALALRTDLGAAGLQRPEQQRESQLQLAALIQKVDLVESRGLSDAGTALGSDPQEHQQDRRQQRREQRKPRQRQANDEELELGETNDSQRVEVQRLVRMLLYNSRAV